MLYIQTAEKRVGRYDKTMPSDREVIQHFSGRCIIIPQPIAQHDFLVVINGCILAPVFDYDINDNGVYFKKSFDDVLLQLIPVTQAILENY